MFKQLLLLCLVCSVHARSLEKQSTSKENNLTSADIAQNQHLINDLYKTLQDENINKTTKYAAFTETMSELVGGYKQKYDDIMKDVKKTINDLPPQLKTAANKFLKYFEEGGFFDDRESLAENIDKIMEPLSESDQKSLKYLAKIYGDRFTDEFDLKPEIDDDDDDDSDEKKSKDDDDDDWDKEPKFTLKSLESDEKDDIGNITVAYSMRLNSTLPSTLASVKVQ